MIHWLSSLFFRKSFTSSGEKLRETVPQAIVIFCFGEFPELITENNSKANKKFVDTASHRIGNMTRRPPQSLLAFMARRLNQSAGKCSFSWNLWKNAERRLFSWLIGLELLCIRIDQLTSTWIDFQLKFSGLLLNCAWRRWKIKLIARGWCLWTEINVPWRETSHNYVIKFNSLCGFTRCDVFEGGDVFLRVMSCF